MILKTIILYIRFGIYMIATAFKKMKYEGLKKKGLNEQAEEYLNMCATNWAKFIVKAAKINVEIIGKENIPKETCLFVGNHQGAIDIPVIMANVEKPVGFVSKTEFENTPIISYWMKQIHCVFMDRENIREAVKSINQGVENLKNGNSMLIFPEGTRARGTKMNEFKKGSLKLGTKANVPIVPLTINGTYKVFEENHGWVKPANVKIIVSKPFYPNELSKEEQSNLAETIHDLIQENLRKMEE